MSSDRRADVAARAFVTIGALLPYWRFLTFRVIYITDDWFASDIFNGEFPGRVLIGGLLRRGQLPVWTSSLCSGLPLVGSPADPVGLAAFTLLPPAPALDLLVVTLLLIAAHGAYALARRFGASRTGASLAGIAFAGSGYVACQLKHLAIVSTVVWLPIGLLLLDRVFVARPRRRWTDSAAFGLVFAQQVLAGFPQSAYICALVYACFGLFRAFVASRRDGWRPATTGLCAVGAAAVLGAAAGAVVLLPLAALTTVSDRQALGWQWISSLNYWPPNAISFLFPYFHGDISNNTYTGPPFFWEDYGYVGVVTFVLALYAAARERRRGAPAFIIGMTLVAYLLVLGRATPVFHAAYAVVPGMKVFRFPTRFLIVVDLGLALLAAIGLTRLPGDLSRLRRLSPAVAALVPPALCVVTLGDLFVHQPRQNPIVPAREWLARPATVDAIHRDTSQPRTFSPRHRDIHRWTFSEAGGWTNVQPYFDLRDTLEPNTGGALWDTPSADCYAGVSARWYVDVWGDHNREASVMLAVTRPDFLKQTLLIHRVVPNLLRTYGVTHVLSPFVEQGVSLPLVAHPGHAYVYRIDDAARVRVVQAATAVATDREAIEHLLDARFDPNKEILLHDTSGPLHPTAAEAARIPMAPLTNSATVAYEDSTHVVIDAQSGADAFLLVADTYYPGWSAEVDGRPTRVYRANVSVRGITLPRGHHQVRFEYHPPRFFTGLLITCAAIAALILGLIVGAHMDRRAERQVEAVA
jgi:membrane protein YfhO